MVDGRCPERFIREPLHPGILVTSRARVHHSKAKAYRPLGGVVLDDELDGCVQWFVHELMDDVWRWVDYRQAVYRKVFRGPSFTVVGISANFVAKLLSMNIWELVQASFALLQEGRHGAFL